MFCMDDWSDFEMTNQTKAAMQMALEASEALMAWCVKNVDKWDFPQWDYMEDACTAMREALAQPTPQEITVFEGYVSSAQTEALQKASAQPMNDVFKFLLGEGELQGCGFGEKPAHERGNFWWRKHLRAALEQPQGEWVDLTAGEIEELFCNRPGENRTIVKEAIAKFKEKNTPPSVEAAIEATKEKAAKIAEQNASWESVERVAAAIRSMK